MQKQSQLHQSTRQHPQTSEQEKKRPQPAGHSKTCHGKPISHVRMVIKPSDVEIPTGKHCSLVHEFYIYTFLHIMVMTIAKQRDISPKNVCHHFLTPKSFQTSIRFFLSKISHFAFHRREVIRFETI